jgi:ferredoxin-NADP reductase/Na+-translocating ferredoxin:NAD+ oxidoreductase RnfD subunit
MYTLVFQVLTIFTIFSFIESYFGLIDFKIIPMLGSLLLLLAICVGLNFALAKIVKLPVQHTSSIITALILFLILVPLESLEMFYALTLAGIVATLSKYFITFRNTHIFNPAALGIFAVSVSGFGSAYWWVGNYYMFPLLLVGGYIIIRKIRRETLALSAFLSVILFILAISLYNGLNFLEVFPQAFFSGPIVFFIIIMLTEPHTIANTKAQQIFYGFLILFVIPLITRVFEFNAFGPETALLIGNAFSFFASYRTRLVLKLKNIEKLNEEVFEYSFEKIYPGNSIKFIPGQYAEWSLPHTNSDDRGMRRYLTISSAPDKDISFATRFPMGPVSSWKTSLKKMSIGDKMFATQFGGDFILPKDENEKIVWIAGGIGITPFISQLRHILGTNGTKRDITLFYCVRTKKDTAFKPLLDQAVEKLGLKLVYVVGDKADQTSVEGMQNVEYGYMSDIILEKYTTGSDYSYYISGPNMMVDMVKKILRSKNIGVGKIHTDYFPGF